MQRERILIYLIEPGGQSERVGKTTSILTDCRLVCRVEFDHSRRDRLLAGPPGNA
jgi:hypothetical protein